METLAWIAKVNRSKMPEGTINEPVVVGHLTLYVLFDSTQLLEIYTTIT